MSADNKQIRESVIIEVTTDKMLGIITFIEPKNGGEGISLEEVKTAIKGKGIIQEHNLSKAKMVILSLHLMWRV